MLSELYAAGWAHSGDCGMVQGGTCFYMSLSHPNFPNVSLDIHVCLDEMPALTMVSLMAGAVIDKEWSDKEIDVTEITEAARAANEEVEE